MIKSEAKLNNIISEINKRLAFSMSKSEMDLIFSIIRAKDKNLSIPEKTYHFVQIENELKSILSILNELNIIEHYSINYVCKAENGMNMAAFSIEIIMCDKYICD